MTAPTTLFESDVISDGTQTSVGHGGIGDWFQSDVISDGTQTVKVERLFCF